MDDVSFVMPEGIIWTRYCVAQCTRCKNEEDMRGSASHTFANFCAQHAQCKVVDRPKLTSITVREDFAARMMAALISARQSNLDHPTSKDELARQASMLAHHAVVYADALVAALDPAEAVSTSLDEFERIATEAERRWTKLS